MCQSRILTFVALFCAVHCLYSEPAVANKPDNFTINQLMSDGRDGRVWRQWRQNIREQGVARVDIVLNRVSGGNDTFVNLRYGDGQTFENGRQVFLTDNNTRTVSWSVGGQPPGGLPLVFNAYMGQVTLAKVTVHYVGGGSSAIVEDPRPPRHKTKPRPPRHHSDRDEDQDEDEDEDEEQISNSQDEAKILRRCRRVTTRRPRIEISRIKQSGGLFSGKHRISGTMSGTCIEEAGYYENGRLRQEIDFPLSDTLKRQEFQVQVRTGKSGELRIYSVNGREAIIEVDDEVTESTN